MACTGGPGRAARIVLSFASALAPLSVALAQNESGEFITGAVASVWEKWQNAMRAVLAKDAAATEAAFGELLATQPSALRLGLFRERTIGGPEGGSVLLFEQDAESGALGENGKRVAELLAAGVEQRNQADDGWWFASMGRFDVAQANFQALLASDPDPVALLEFADRDPRRQETLVRLANHPVLGPSAQGLLKLLARGESLVKSDPGRIKTHIERLAGPPRAFTDAVALLKDSGEYAIPFMLQYLRDPAQGGLTQAILRAMPQIDRAALNPLVMALRMDDPTTLVYVIRTLGQLPYRQSLPYLLRLRESPATPPEIRSEVEAALSELRGRGVEYDPSLGAARMFELLAEAYYENLGSLAADPRLDTANVWYWRDDMLQNIPVPTQIFNEIMAMRCCEEALRLDPGNKAALALWLASNFRREAQLGPQEIDATRPANYPSAAYFARSGGAEYCLMTLARAVRDDDPAVALGAIAALRSTAGPASLLGGSTGASPLADALNFSNRLVRIRAALALGHAAPREPFANSQNLVPVLSEALMQHGGSRNALIVDPDADSANALAAILRGEGFTVITSGGLLAGLEQMRRERPGLDVLLIASDVQNPPLRQALGALRQDPLVRSVPTVIISKRGDRDEVRAMARDDPRLIDLLPGAEPAQVIDAVARVSKAVGYEAITPQLGDELALEAAQALRLLALTGSPAADVSRAQDALIAVIGTTKQRTLQLTVADVLGHLASGAAQEAIARIALDAAQEPDLRVAMLAALAEAAKRHGNLLSPETVARLVETVASEQDPALRDAASQALGALNLPSDTAGELIRRQYQG